MLKYKCSSFGAEASMKTTIAGALCPEIILQFKWVQIRNKYLAMVADTD